MKKKFTIGIDLGGTNVRAGLVDDKKILDIAAQSIRSSGSVDDVLEDLFAVIDPVFDKRVLGIGIGVPSLVDTDRGVLFEATNIPSWKKVPLRKILEKRYGVAVVLDNDANCFALGEKYFGLGRESLNYVGLIIGTGLGAGIISNGHLHSGLLCAAGEFGLIPYRDSILEHYASGQFFKRFDWEGAALAQAAKAGDPKALAVFAEYGTHLAFALQLVMYALAPEMILFGGSVSQSFPYFRESLDRGLASFAYPGVLNKTKFKVSKQKEIAVLGAASLPRQKRFQYLFP
jgi:glucokinase